MPQDPSHIPRTSPELIQDPTTGTYSARELKLMPPPLRLGQDAEQLTNFKRRLTNEHATRQLDFLRSAPAWNTEASWYEQVFGEYLDYNRDPETDELRAYNNEKASHVGRWIGDRWRYTRQILTGAGFETTVDPNFVLDQETFAQLRKNIPREYWGDLTKQQSLLDAEKFVARIRSDAKFIEQAQNYIFYDDPGTSLDDWGRFNHNWVMPLTDPIPLVGAVIVDRGAAAIGRSIYAAKLAQEAIKRGAFIRGMGIHAAAEGIWAATFTGMADVAGPYVREEEYVWNTGLAVLIGGGFGGFELTGFQRGLILKHQRQDSLMQAIANQRLNLREALRYATDPMMSNPHYIKRFFQVYNNSNIEDPIIKEAIDKVRLRQQALWDRLEREVMGDVSHGDQWKLYDAEQMARYDQLAREAGWVGETEMPLRTQRQEIEELLGEGPKISAARGMAGDLEILHSEAWGRLSKQQQDAILHLQSDWIIRHPEGARMLQDMYEEISARYEAIIRSTPDEVGEAMFESFLRTTDPEVVRPLLNKLDPYDAKPLAELMDGNGNVGSLHTEEILNTIPRTANQSISQISKEVNLLKAQLAETAAGSAQASMIRRTISQLNGTIEARGLEKDIARLSRNVEIVQKELSTLQAELKVLKQPEQLDWPYTRRISPTETRAFKSPEALRASIEQQIANKELAITAKKGEIKSLNRGQLREAKDALRKIDPDLQARKNIELVNKITSGQAGLLSFSDIELLSRINPTALAGAELDDLIRIVGNERWSAAQYINDARILRDRAREVSKRLEKRPGMLVMNDNNQLGVIRGVRETPDGPMYIVDYENLAREAPQPPGRRAAGERGVDPEGRAVPEGREGAPEGRVQPRSTSEITDPENLTLARSEDITVWSLDEGLGQAIFPTTPLKTTLMVHKNGRPIGTQFRQTFRGYDVTIERMAVGHSDWGFKDWRISFYDLDGVHRTIYPPVAKGHNLSDTLGGLPHDPRLANATKSQVLEVMRERLGGLRTADFADETRTRHLLGAIASDSTEEAWAFLHPPHAPDDPLISLARSGKLSEEWSRLSNFGPEGEFIGEFTPDLRVRIANYNKRKASEIPFQNIPRGADADFGAPHGPRGQGFGENDLMDDAPRLSKWWRLVALGGHRTKMLSHDLGVVREMSKYVYGGPMALVDGAGNYVPSGGPIGSVFHHGSKRARRQFVQYQLSDVTKVMRESKKAFHELEQGGIIKAIRGGLDEQFDDMVARYLQSGGKIKPAVPEVEILVKNASDTIVEKFKTLRRWAQDSGLEEFKNVVDNDLYFSRIAQTGKFDQLLSSLSKANGMGPRDQMLDFFTKAIMAGEGWDELGARATARRLIIFYEQPTGFANTADEIAAHSGTTINARIDDLEAWFHKIADQHSDGSGRINSDSLLKKPFTEAERESLMRGIGAELKTSKRTLYKVKADPSTTYTFTLRNGQTKEVYFSDLFETNPSIVLDRYADDIYKRVQERAFLEAFPVNGKVLKSVPELMNEVVRVAQNNSAVRNPTALKKELEILRKTLMGQPLFSRTELGGIASIARAVTSVLRIPGFVRAQAPETMAAAVSGGAQHMFDQMPAFTRIVNNMKNGTIEDATLREMLNSFVGMGDTEATMPLLVHQFDMLTDGQPMFGAGRAGEIYKGASRTQPRVGVASQYTALNVYGDMWAFKAYMNRLTHMARTGIGEADFIGRDNVRIAQIGFTRSEWDEFMGALRAPGVIESEMVGVGGKSLGLDKLHVEKLSARHQRMFRASSGEWIRQVMQRSDPLDRWRPMITSEWGDLFYQFKAFSVSSQMNHLGRGIQLRDSLAAQTLMAQVFGAMIVTTALSYLYYWDEPDKLKEALTFKSLFAQSTRKVAMFGMMPDVTDAALYALGQDPWFTNMHEPTLLKFPVIGAVTDIGRIPGTVWDAASQGHLDQQQYRRLMRAVPLANAWYATALSNTLIEPNLPPPQD